MLSWLTDRLVEGYLEWARLEAGLADGDKTLLGEEYGEREEPAGCICPEADKELLLLSGGDLGDKKEKGTAGTKTLHIQAVTPQNTQYIKGVEYVVLLVFRKALL